MAAPPTSTKTSLQQTTIRPRPPTVAATKRCWRSVPRRIRLRHRPTSGRPHPAADAAALRRIGLCWGFPIYLASKGGYQDSVLPTGHMAGSPEDALDTACGLYLADPTA
jgi:hypothetical protein